MAGEKRKKNRSPNYPAVSLKVAIDYLARLHEYANGLHPVPLGSAIEKAWKLNPGSSRGLQIVAALMGYGLIGDKGSGDKRQIFITPVGGKIHGNHSDRNKLIQEAAVKPSIHRELWDLYKETGLPPDDSIRQYLVWDRDGNKFNEAAVDSFIGSFRETVEFARLGDGNTAIDGDGGGVDPAMEENETSDDGKAESQRQKGRRIKLKEDQQEAVFPLDEGEAVLIWPSRLSADSFNDFKDWVDLIVKKVKRSAVDSGNPSRGGE